MVVKTVTVESSDFTEQITGTAGGPAFSIRMLVLADFPMGQPDRKNGQLGENRGY